MLPARPTPEGSEVVAVTGAATGLGCALVERLTGQPLGIDVRRIDARRVDVRRAGGDVWEPLLASRLTGATTVVHLATSYDLAESGPARRVLNVRGTAQVLEAALAAGARRVVLVTSAEVYGALPDNPVPLLDSAPLRGVADDETLAGEHVEVERLADHAARTGLSVTVLRPATLVGGPLGPAYDGQLLRQLGAPRLVAVRGVEPLWQLCHVEDLVSALELAATGAVTGGLAVASTGSVPQRLVESMSGRRRLELPASVAISTAERLHRLGVTTSSPRELDHLLGPLVVAADGLRAAGWVPSWTNEAALRAHLSARSEGRGGAYTAAGATVAVLGSAALVRRARRRRRGV